MVIELGFLKKSADKILLIKRETGILPTLRERLLLASTGIGLLFFAIFIDQKMDRITTLILGTVSVLALTVSKLLVLRSRITPVREAGQRA